MAKEIIKTVACIMPLYNYANFLEASLESLSNQSRLPDEVIIVDDCSTDNPKMIIDTFASRLPINYILQEKNGGLAKARNTGINSSRSQFVFSFDADDLLRPRAIEKHLELAQENTIVTCPLMAFGSQNYTARPEKASLERLFKGNCIYSNSMFPKSLWERVGGFDEGEIMRLGLEDWEFWIRCAGLGANFVTGEYISLLWRRHPKAMSEASANPNWDKITNYMREKNKHLLSDH